MEAKKPVDTRVQELAARLYVELIGRTTAIAGSDVKMDSSPENIAKLSFKLAEVFFHVDRELDAAKQPDTKYKLDASDIAAWMK